MKHAIPQIHVSLKYILNTLTFFQKLGGTILFREFY